MSEASAAERLIPQPERAVREAGPYIVPPNGWFRNRNGAPGRRALHGVNESPVPQSERGIREAAPYKAYEKRTVSNRPSV